MPKYLKETSYSKIKEQISKAKDVEMKVAVAASKKTGKSTIVDTMLGVQLAPTSLDLPTPNICVYRKSKDDKFHLSYSEEHFNYDAPKPLRSDVNKIFKKAAGEESNVSRMYIDYVSEGNNFESYTIFDTPGPDRAGQHNHTEQAKEGIRECDVAIFAIDYSKHLTKDEVAFLQEVKSVFEEKQKFHTLIFVINKLDLALNDMSAKKSKTLTIDYIRSELARIDPKFSECAIFATSAQNYFFTQQLKNAAEHFGEQLPELKAMLEPEASPPLAFC